jgi:hypothetical protein
MTIKTTTGPCRMASMTTLIRISTTIRISTNLLFENPIWRLKLHKGEATKPRVIRWQPEIPGLIIYAGQQQGANEQPPFF